MYSKPFKQSDLNSFGKCIWGKFIGLSLNHRNKHLPEINIWMIVSYTLNIASIKKNATILSILVWSALQ